MSEIKPDKSDIINSNSKHIIEPDVFKALCVFLLLVIQQNGEFRCPGLHMVQELYLRLHGCAIRWAIRVEALVLYLKRPHLAIIEQLGGSRWELN